MDADKKKFFKKKIWIVGFVFIMVATALYLTSEYRKSCFDTAWGTVQVDDPLILDLINSDELQRLKEVDQSGPPRYFYLEIPRFSRFDHSIGVWALLKKARVSIKQQVAGLLHDISHTVFSHAGDFFTGIPEKYTDTSFQDSIHMNFLKQSSIKSILLKYGVDIEELSPEKREYTALEQPDTQMCADRIEYNVHTGLILNLISKKEAKAIINDLRFDEGMWFFTDKSIAEKFANISLYCTMNLWGGDISTSQNHHMAMAINRAIAIGLMSEKEIFSTDPEVLAKLKSSTDDIIVDLLKQLAAPKDMQHGIKYQTLHFVPKFRGINPLVKVGDKLVKLSELSPMFASYFQNVYAFCKNGFDYNFAES